MGLMTEEEALTYATHRHFKGGLYRWLGIGRSSDDGGNVVLYQHIWPHAPALWSRPAAEFYGTLPDGCTLRFQPLAGVPEALVGPWQATGAAAQLALAQAAGKAQEKAHMFNPTYVRLVQELAWAASLVSVNAQVRGGHRELRVVSDNALDDSARIHDPLGKNL